MKSPVELEKEAIALAITIIAGNEKKLPDETELAYLKIGALAGLIVATRNPVVPLDTAE